MPRSRESSKKVSPLISINLRETVVYIDDIRADNKQIMRELVPFLLGVDNFNTLYGETKVREYASGKVYYSTTGISGGVFTISSIMEGQFIAGLDMFYRKSNSSPRREIKLKIRLSEKTKSFNILKFRSVFQEALACYNEENASFERRKERLAALREGREVIADGYGDNVTLGSTVNGVQLFNYTISNLTKEEIRSINGLIRNTLGIGSSRG